MLTSDSCRIVDPARLRSRVLFWQCILAIVIVGGCTSDGGMERAVDQRGCDRPAGQGAASAQAAPPELRAAYIASVQAGASQEYRVERAGAGWVAKNPGQQFSVELTAAG